MNMRVKSQTWLNKFSTVSTLALTAAKAGAAAAGAGAEGEGNAEGEGEGGGAGGAGGSAAENQEGAAAGGAKKKTEGAGAGAEGDGGAGGEGGEAITETREELITRLSGDDTVLKAHLEKVIAKEGDNDAWREEMAGGDAKLLERLKRFASKADVARSLDAAEKRLRERGGVALPGADATPEQWAEFATANMGRPAKSEELTVQPNLPEGEELNEDETGVLRGVLGLAWKSGKFGKAQFDDLGQIVADMLVGGRKEVVARAKAKQTASRAELGKVWGGGEANVERLLRVANQYTAMRCEQVGVDPQALSSLLLEDGTRVGDHPLFAQVMAAGGLDQNENPMMQPRDETAGGVGEMEKELIGLYEKSKSKDRKVRAEYDSDADKKRRLHLNTMIERSKGGGGGGGAAPARGDRMKVGK